MAPSPPPFIVAGGGVGGLTAALVPARAGHAVQVLEQGDAFGEIGAGIQLGPNVFRMFEHLGLTEAIREVAYFPPNLVMRDLRTGEQIVRAPVGEQALAAYRQPYGVIYRVDLHRVLFEQCRALPAIELQVKSKVVGFTQRDGGVDVQLADGRRIGGCALIGAHELHARFAQAAAPVRQLLQKIETWKMWVLCDREPVARRSQGRATLLGGAAHQLPDDLPCAFEAYERARYLRTGRVQLTARFYGEIYHASGVMREPRNHMFQSGSEAAGFIGTHWLYQGVVPDHSLQ